ncbi:Subunit of heteropentameric Replication factor C (RF-C) [Sorochytrium milnesiophthora]
MDDIAAQEQVVQVLRKTLESQNLPHLLFYGPPGTGKTSTILALAKELYSPEMYRSRVLELNASDERGIDIIREKVKNFAKVAVAPPATGGYPCPPYKIIILDEADSMTTDAQSALRRVMETYSKITRFCLICNYVTRIIEPLTSRCAKFRFRSLDKGDVVARLQNIAMAENVEVDTAAVDAIVEMSEGDLRKSIMYLHSAARLLGSDSVTQSSIYEIAGAVPPQVIDGLVNMWINRATFNAMAATVRSIVQQGYSATQVLTQLYDAVIVSPMLTSMQKAQAAEVMARMDKRLVDGADEHLQLLDMMTTVAAVAAQ